MPRVINFGTELWLDVEGVCVEPLLEHFARYLPPRLATATRLEDVARISLIGPKWATVLAGVDRRHAAARPPQPLRALALRTEVAELIPAVVRTSADGPGLDLYPRQQARLNLLRSLQVAVDRAGGCQVGDEAFAAWRVERGIPVYGHDISLDNLPQETGLVERTVSFDKGCYTGQEVVARIHYRGHVNRRLRALRFGAGPAEPGAPLFTGDREVGTVTSTALSPTLGAIGMGYVRREIDAGTSLSLSPGGETSCHVRNLPFTQT